MLNRVQIEGDIVRHTWGQTKESGFFVFIKQEKTFNKFTTTSYFSLFANQPLAKKLADIVEKYPNAHIVVEGKLKTYLSKKDDTYKTSILIEKIISWNPPITKEEK